MKRQARKVVRLGAVSICPAAPLSPKAKEAVIRHKRWNGKRKCGFCKKTLRSQKVYNDHVDSCKESHK
jgi:hypothetical protein